jgi:hypothetical protein
MRTITLQVLARTETVFLLWGGHVDDEESVLCLTMTARVASLGSGSLTALRCAG